MNLLSPIDETSQQHFLDVFLQDNCKILLKYICKKFSYQDLAIFQITIIALTYCKDGFYYCDFSETNNKVFNLLIPLKVLPNIDTELFIKSEFQYYIHKYKYYVNNLLLGDSEIHTTTPCNYTESNVIPIILSVSIAHITNNSVSKLKLHISQLFPPRDVQFLIRLKFIHQKRKNNVDNKLPTIDTDQFNYVQKKNLLKMVVVQILLQVLELIS